MAQLPHTLSDSLICQLGSRVLAARTVNEDIQYIWVSGACGNRINMLIIARTEADRHLANTNGALKCHVLTYVPPPSPPLPFLASIVLFTINISVGSALCVLPFPVRPQDFHFFRQCWSWTVNRSLSGQTATPPHPLSRSTYVCRLLPMPGNSWSWMWNSFSMSIFISLLGYSPLSPLPLCHWPCPSACQCYATAISGGQEGGGWASLVQC